MTSQLTIADSSTLLKYVSDAVLIFDEKNQVVFENTVAQQLAPEVRAQLFSANLWETSSDTSTKQLSDKGFHPGNLRKVQLQDGVAVILNGVNSLHSMTRDTLKHISRALEESENVFVAATQAIRESLMWRWIAITRFVDEKHLEVLAFRDGDSAMDTWQYEIAGTPCELVVDTNQFTLYSDLLDAFPNYTALHDMGALTYAGLVYRGSDNRPLGHVMAMHDARDVDFAMAEEVLSCVTLSLSSHFQLNHVKAQLAEAKCIANEDPLTGVGSRYAFEQRLENIRQQNQMCAKQSYALAIVDLDLLKYVNDHLGHQTGDRFIQLMAQELTKAARQSDHVFRIGGDEFALILPHSSQSFLLSFYERFKKAISRVRQVMRFPVDASIGFASLKEVGFNTDSWIALADQRMYEDKSSKQRGSGHA